MTTLDLNYLNARKLIIPNYEILNITLVGCGGTGSWLAASLARIARILTREHNKTIHLIFCDPDIVEPANIDRQNFCQAEVGRYKADSLAVRYSTAWGVEIRSVNTTYFQEINRGGLKLLIGCVDNAAARTAIAHSLFGPGCVDNVFANMGITQVTQRWWLDCGNDVNSGQVVLGCARQPEFMAGCFDLMHYATSAPAPDLVHPDLLVARLEELEGVDLSCADIALRNLQGLSINQHVAAVAANMLTQLLLTDGTKTFASYFNLAAGSQTSLYCTPEHYEQVCFPNQPAQIEAPALPKKGRRHHGRRQD